MSGEMTLMPNDWRGGSHRSIRVRKKENGYAIDATFQVEREDHRGKLGLEREEREYVFYTVPEVLDFVKEYLLADPEALRV